jgi:hypothetical protein
VSATAVAAPGGRHAYPAMPASSLEPRVRRDGTLGLVLLVIAGLVLGGAVVGTRAAWRAWQTRRVWRAYGPY